MQNSDFALVIRCALVVLAASAAVDAEGPVEPVLSKYCLGCHNDNDREAGLSLQTMDSLKRGSEHGPVLNPAELSDSLLLKVLAKGSEKQMPPPDEAQPTDAEREQLRQWVMSGAKIVPMAAGVPDVPAVAPKHQQQPALFCCQSLPDGQSVIVGGAGLVSRRAVSDGQEVWNRSLDRSAATSVSLGHQNPWVAAAVGLSGVSGGAVLLSVNDGSVIKTFGGHTDAAYSAVLSPDDRLLATAGYDRRILLHDVQTGQILQTLEGHNGSIFSLAFDPTGKVLCSASADGTVKVWNTASGQRLDTLSQPLSEQYSVLVGTDGQRIYAAGADNRIRIWELASRESAQINPLLVSRFAHEQAIHHLALSSDGSRLASVAEDGTLRIWTTDPFAHLQSLDPQTDPVTDITFISNQQLFLTLQTGKTRLLSVSGEPTAPKQTPIEASTAMLVTLSGDLHDVKEAADMNDDAAHSQNIPLPARISGTILPSDGQSADVDCFRFQAHMGQQLVLEVLAARNKSPLDSKLDVLDTDGNPVLQTRLQAVRDSYFTFRGKDSDTSDDFRVFNWQEMELNEYLYADGEVVRLWLYPRGPDSGFKVYPGFGKRFTYFGTTPTVHALQAPCFIVVPRAPDETIVENGLPVFPVYFENDDDGRRELGADSRLLFTAPADGDYVARIRDARGFSGNDFHYQLTVRAPQPSFRVSLNATKLTMARGTGRELQFTADRIDGYEGPITISAADLPPGFGFSGPIEIENGQLKAFGTLYASTDATAPTDEQVKAIRFVATTANDSGTAVREQEVARMEELKLVDETKLRVVVSAAQPAADSKPGPVNPAEPVVLKIRPGETISAWLQLERVKHDGVVSLGKEDSGRNLPHGVYVDNIGLNGLLLLNDQNQREFFITASKIVQPTVSTFYLRADLDGITSLPVVLEVLPPDDSEKRVATSAAR
ncbi:MAG: c-type cytochrome domain-containing protein [Planctomycetaceae bacterium]